MNYYVYFLQDPRKENYSKNGYALPYEPFYIGKGKNNRCFEYKDRSKWITNKINKLNKIGLKPYVTIIGGYTEDEAYEVEKDLIKIFGRKILNEGPLLNMQLGGRYAGFEYINSCLPNSMKERKHSEETKQKLRLAKLGKPSPRKGIKNPKTSASLMGHIVTKATREKLRLANLGKQRN